MADDQIERLFSKMFTNFTSTTRTPCNSSLFNQSRVSRPVQPQTESTVPSSIGDLFIQSVVKQIPALVVSALPTQNELDSSDSNDSSDDDNDDDFKPKQSSNSSDPDPLQLHEFFKKLSTPGSVANGKLYR
jgi:hypothetical protein